MLRKFWTWFRGALHSVVVLLALVAVAQFALKLDCVRQWVEQLFSTQQQRVCELLENQQIAELATRKMKWKILTIKESTHESLVVETIYTLKFGFDLSEIDPSAIVADAATQTVTLPLPQIRLLSVDTFGDRKRLVSKKTFVARVVMPAHDSGIDEAEEGRQLIREITEQRLIDADQLAADFQKALTPIWRSVGSFRLKVLPPPGEVDVEALFQQYQQDK
ncbi:MAG: DUF4230 domain-containing protein [Kiritimatiellae bacterium]|nr:DUF4230 domain-containing protein [Kiritimatiellia bacterium]